MVASSPRRLLLARSSESRGRVETPVVERAGGGNPFRNLKPGSETLGLCKKNLSD